MASSRRKLELINLKEMAAVVNHEFQLDPKVADLTPYDWWRRNKDDNMNPRMPKPVMMAGRVAVFRRREIVEWYGQWKGIKPRWKETQED